MELNEKSARLSNWLRIGTYLTVIILIFIPIIPGVSDVIRDNFRAIKIIQCDDKQWIDTDINEINPAEVSIWARSCPTDFEDQETVTALENALMQLPEDTLLSAQYSRLYWEMGMREEAFHQLSAARAGSISLRWTAYLAKTNLADAAFEGYVASRWWGARRVCDEIYASAEAAPDVNVLANLVTYCENNQP